MMHKYFDSIASACLLMDDLPEDMETPRYTMDDFEPIVAIPMYNQMNTPDIDVLFFEQLKDLTARESIETVPLKHVYHYYDQQGICPVRILIHPQQIHLKRVLETNHFFGDYEEGEEWFHYETSDKLPINDIYMFADRQYVGVVSINEFRGQIGLAIMDCGKVIRLEIKDGEIA